MAYDTALADRIRPLLARRKGMTEKKMFGGVGFLLSGNMCVGVWKEFLIVRVGPEAYDECLDEAHVRKFDITGRAMSGWLMVEPAGIEDQQSLAEWVSRALRFVAGLPAKEGRG